MLLFTQVDSIDDAVKDCLNRIAQLNLDGITDGQTNDFKKRKLIQEV